MIYQVLVAVPAIDEVVTLTASSEDEAKALAVASAVQRAAAQARVVVKQAPDD